MEYSRKHDFTEPNYLEVNSNTFNVTDIICFMYWIKNVKRENEGKKQEYLFEVPKQIW